MCIGCSFFTHTNTLKLSFDQTLIHIFCDSNVTLQHSCFLVTMAAKFQQRHWDLSQVNYNRVNLVNFLLSLYITGTYFKSAVCLNFQLKTTDFFFLLHTTVTSAFLTVRSWATLGKV